MSAAELENPSNDQRSISELLHILHEHRAKCEREGRYVEAELARKRVKELQTHEERRRREELKVRHQAELTAVEQAHSREIERFRSAWDERLAQFDERATELDSAMQDRHTTEFADYRQKVEAKPCRVKFSSQLLNMRRIEQTLAKQKKYAEAQHVKLRADALERWEVEKATAEEDQRMANREALFRHQQAQELAALRKRIRSGRQQLIKARDDDIARLVRRFKNLRSELESSQKIQKAKQKRYPSAARAAHLDRSRPSSSQLDTTFSSMSSPSQPKARPSPYETGEVTVPVVRPVPGGPRRRKPRAAAGTAGAASARRSASASNESQAQTRVASAGRRSDRREEIVYAEDAEFDSPPSMRGVRAPSAELDTLDREVARIRADLDDAAISAGARDQEAERVAGDADESGDDADADAETAAANRAAGPDYGDDYDAYDAAADSPHGSAPPHSGGGRV
eukprot:gnl/Ergobibamus_cyprinoides/287.p1 GENE.gnl/Ergobibamus_cyprinoides/287~~gnl/Ergobibamus_cyprinoides/287.p1  ORF type:complete len:456 (+),score=147.46 gnl/Ergobibamus_cyprinoides/287:1-1368(+)